MKVYLDVSCLNRPFDDQGQPRIRMEAEAVALILERADAGKWRHVSSDMARIEVARLADDERRRRVESLLPRQADIIPLTLATFRRAEELIGLGFKAADAVHVAAAEQIGGDVFLTRDDRLLAAGRRARKKLRVIVSDPVSWIREVDDA